jgi:hypothetical protein
MLDPLAAAKRAGRGAPEELRIVELGGDVASRSAASVAVMPVFGEDSAVPRLSGPQSSVFG